MPTFDPTFTEKGLMAEDEKERSESGAEIIRHMDRTREWKQAENPAGHLEEVEAHVEKHLGKIETVYHELVSDMVHIDILFVPADKTRPYHVLVTSGVSDQPMKVPEGAEEFRRAELLIALPANWPLTREAFEDEKNYWPLRWLKVVGRLPHEYGSWIGWGHTIPNGDPPAKIENTDFIGVMLAPPYWLPAEFFQLESKSCGKISFYQMTPLYLEEMDLKLKQGADELESRFEKADLGFVLDIKRKNVAAKKKWFGK